MSNTIELKRKIKSIRNTKQITKAMELVSASKMRRAQDYAKLSRDYNDAADQLLSHLSTLPEVKTHQLFNHRKVKSRLYILITSNSGLAGSYNYNVIKLLNNLIIEDNLKSVNSKVICIGKKGSNLVSRLKGVDLIAAYHSFGDHPSSNDIKPLLNTVLSMYKDDEVDEVKIIYTLFKSNLIQVAQVKDILPIIKVENADVNYTNFEPAVDEVLDSSVERLIDALLWQAVLESLASEHSMRMLAMKSATDNANDLIGEYTLMFNTARQSGITQELAEISGGFEALKS